MFSWRNKENINMFWLTSAPYLELEEIRSIPTFFHPNRIAPEVLMVSSYKILAVQKQVY